MRSSAGMSTVTSVAAVVAVLLGVGGCGSSSHPSMDHPLVRPTRSSASSTASSPRSPATESSSTVAALAGGPVPSGTKATSVTFISPRTAFVLGTAPCSGAPCSVILRSRDRGHSWVGLPAPRESVSTFLGTGLWGLRFANVRHGYAFGDGLWATADGGGSWHRGAAPGRIVLALAAVEDRELVAVAASCLPGESHCANGLTLYHRPIGAGRWTVVAGARTNLFGASIAVHGADVWVRTLSNLYVSRDGGASFRARPQPCYPSRPDYGMPVSVTDDGAHIYLLCAGEGAAGSTAKYVFRADPAGLGWTLVGRPPRTGDGGDLSAGGDGALIITTASGASWLYRSTDGGRSWKTVLTENDGGAGWNDLGFTTATDGVVVHGPAVSDGESDGRPGQLLLSDDGGQTFLPVEF